ncbi:MAG: O-antigen ligase family protein [Sterolibacteriaceae bacterium]|nr:O-antigen ligase family protein [Sterolibacteriaceae bacterium]MBK9085329.1 O-antigen ligase family protein [Sterolibacteriaceae bacterium]
MESRAIAQTNTNQATGVAGVVLPQGASVGLKLYLMFMVSWFLHIPERISVLGSLRIDLLLVLLLAVLAASQPRSDPTLGNTTGKWLKLLIAYAILSIPLVEWPGSVVKTGLPNFIKAAVFYYFTVAFVKSESDLRRLVVVFVGCQTFRFLEPLYLHLTDGYWGSIASMAGWEYLERLSGAPSDVVNPNGLAWIVCTALPFLYFSMGLSWRHRLAGLILIPAALYVLFLTGSRSGVVGLGVIVIGIVLKAKRRVALLATIIAVAVLALPMLSSDLQDRYLSIVGMGEKNAGTADERMEGMEAQIDVALRRPLFGYGLGTSAEANGNFTASGPYVGAQMPAHNLYVEIAQELGLIGLAIFLVFMKSIYSGFAAGRRKMDIGRSSPFLSRLIDALQVWLAMNFVFSFASFGLSSFDWYLFGGIAAILERIVRNGKTAVQPSKPSSA